MVKEVRGKVETEMQREAINYVESKLAENVTLFKE